MCACYYAFLACLNAMCCSTGWHTYACQLYKMLCGNNSDRSILHLKNMAWHVYWKGKAKVSSPVDDCHSVATIHHIIFFCKCCSLHRNFDDSTLCLSHITNCGTHLCESSLSSITDKPLSIRILFIILAITSFTLYTLCVVIMGCYPAAVFYTLHN